MKFRRIRIGLIAIFVVLIVLFASKPFLTDDHRPSNTVEIGVRAKSGKIISTGKIISSEVIEEGLEFELSQDIYESREYLVLFFIDYEQVLVNIADEKKSGIYLELESNDSKKISFSLDVPKNSNELSILIIKKPDFMVDKGDTKRAIKTEDILSLRYRIDSNSDKEYELSTIDHNRIDKNIVTRVFLSKKVDELKLCTVLESEEEVYISLGNKRDEVIEYAVIALQDWIQVPIEDMKVQYFSVGVNEHVNFKHRLPKTDKDINYQIVVFPNPYNLTDQDLSSTFTYATHRIHVIESE